MSFARSGRTLFVLQWILAVLLPVFVFLGRGFVGAELGWMAVIGVVYGGFVILALLVPPLIALGDREARRARSVRRAYGIATGVVWLALIVAGLSIPDAGDSGSVPSALTTWTGLSHDGSEAVFAVAAGIAIVAWVAAIVTAVVGIARSPRAASA